MRYKFVDEAAILVRSGNGGAGCVSFRREKFVPFGGPDGGEGGRGGDVTIRADAQLATLLDYKFRPRHIADHGRPGEGNQRSGRSGEPVVLRVPVGTLVYCCEDDRLLADLSSDGAEVVVAKGGRGGKGNVHFKSSTRQAPRFSQPGEPGEQLELRLELKLLADVGLVGFPNVGKSSLIARISAARPKIADYPFTTLVPNLGVVQFGDLQHFVVADVPGLIVGAHQGAGLGSRFLRHIERVRRIVHMVTVEPDTPDRDPIHDFQVIEEEMRLHEENLVNVPRVLVLNKMDLDFVAVRRDEVAAFAEQRQLPFFAISAATGSGVQELVNHLGQALSQA
ncbi:GTPase ObgE [Myxococcota bacterium]